MKKILVKIILTAISLMMLSSCKSEQNIPDTNITTTVENSSVSGEVAESALITCCYKSDFKGDLSNSLVFTEPEAMEEYINEIVFYPSEEIYDLKLCAISMPHTEETFVVDKVFKVFKKISPEKPLVYRMTFPGDVPNTAFSFKDNADHEYLYAIYQSGYDSSIIIELLKKE